MIPVTGTQSIRLPRGEFDSNSELIKKSGDRCCPLFESITKHHRFFPRRDRKKTDRKKYSHYALRCVFTTLTKKYCIKEFNTRRSCLYSTSHVLKGSWSRMHRPQPWAKPTPNGRSKNHVLAVVRDVLSTSDSAATPARVIREISSSADTDVLFRRCLRSSSRSGLKRRRL